MAAFDFLKQLKEGASANLREQRSCLMKLGPSAHSPRCSLTISLSRQRFAHWMKVDRRERTWKRRLGRRCGITAQIGCFPKVRPKRPGPKPQFYLLFPANFRIADTQELGFRSRWRRMRARFCSKICKIVPKETQLEVPTRKDLFLLY